MKADRDQERDDDGGDDDDEEMDDDDDENGYRFKAREERIEMLISKWPTGGSPAAWLLIRLLNLQEETSGGSRARRARSAAGKFPLRFEGGDGGGGWGGGGTGVEHVLFSNCG